MTVIGKRSPLLTSKTPAQPREAPVVAPVPSVVDLERAILAIGDGMKRINESRLTRDALILLLQDATKLGKRDIAYVLNAMDSLEATYLKPRKPGGAGSG